MQKAASRAQELNARQLREAHPLAELGGQLAGSALLGGALSRAFRIPAEITVGGKTFDPRPFLARREATERSLLDRGFPSKTARIAAVKAEKEAVAKSGINWKQYWEFSYDQDGKLWNAEREYAPPAGSSSNDELHSLAHPTQANNSVSNGTSALSFGTNGRKLDLLFNRDIDQSNTYNTLRAKGNASRIGIADTPANRTEVTRLFNEAYNNPATIVGPSKLPGSNVREFFLPGVTGTGSKIRFIEQNGKVITIIAK